MDIIGCVCRLRPGLCRFPKVSGAPWPAISTAAAHHCLKGFMIVKGTERNHSVYCTLYDCAGLRVGLKSSKGSQCILHTVRLRWVASGSAK